MNLIINPLRISLQKYTIGLKSSSLNSETNFQSIDRLQNFTYMPLNFKGMQTPELSEQLQNLEDMHCPYCGTKMLNRKELDKILKKADKVDTAQKLSEFFTTHRQQINPIFDKTIDIFEKNYKRNPNRSLENLIMVMSETIKKDKIPTLKESVTKLETFKKEYSLCERDEKLVNACASEIKNMIENGLPPRFFNNFSYLLQHTIGNLQSDKKSKMYDIINTPIRNIFCTEVIYRDSKNTGKTGAPLILHNMLDYSKSGITSLNPKQNTNGNTFMLSCNHCILSRESVYGMPVSKRANYFRHIEELCQKALDGKFEGNNKYPLELRDAVLKCTKNKLVPDDNTPSIKNLSKTTEYKRVRLQNIDFPIVELDDVPCYCCGKKTLKHDKAVEIQEKIKKAQNLRQLSEIMSENLEYIRDGQLHLVETFIRVLKTTPDISEKKIIEKLRNAQNEKIYDAFCNTAKSYREIASEHNLDKHDKELLTEYMKETDKLINSLDTKKPACFDDYKEIFNKTVSKLNFSLSSRFFIISAREITPLVINDDILYPLSEITQKVGSPLKVIMQNCIGKAKSTIDHFDAKVKYKDIPDEKGIILRNKINQKSHLAVMCKNCNEAKGRKDMSVWVKIHPEMKVNHEKYLNFVQNKSDNGALKGFANYRAENRKVFQDLAGGKQYIDNY